MSVLLSICNRPYALNIFADIDYSVNERITKIRTFMLVDVFGIGALC